MWIKTAWARSPCEKTLIISLTDLTPLRRYRVWATPALSGLWNWHLSPCPCLAIWPILWKAQCRLCERLLTKRQNAAQHSVRENGYWKKDMMRLEDIRPDSVVRGIESEPVIIVTTEMYAMWSSRSSTGTKTAPCTKECCTGIRKRRFPARNV